MAETMFTLLLDEYPHLTKYFTQADFVSMGPSKSGKADNYHIVFKGSNAQQEPFIFATRNKESGTLHLLPTSQAIPGWGAFPCQPNGIGYLGVRGDELTLINMECYAVACRLCVALIAKYPTEQRHQVGKAES